MQPGHQIQPVCNQHAEQHRAFPAQAFQPDSALQCAVLALGGLMEHTRDGQSGNPVSRHKQEQRDQSAVPLADQRGNKCPDGCNKGCFFYVYVCSPLRAYLQLLQSCPQCISLTAAMAKRRREP